MKRRQSTALLMLLALAMPLVLTQCTDDASTSAAETIGKAPSLELAIEDIPADSLSQEEASGLIFLREEEKLARDVYMALYAEWGQRIFSNIASSESQHTSAIKVLLDRYELDDPMTDDEAGVFQNATLATLYSDLVSQGKESLTAALSVGAAIEEIDILDLKEQLETVVDNEDIKFVYENLMGGSENHLRAFVRNLGTQGIEYTPQYLTQEDYTAIISAASKQGRWR